MTPFAPAAAASARPAAFAPVMLAGAVVAIVSAFLAWVDSGRDASNGFDITAKFLYDDKANGRGGLSIGLVVVILAGAALLAAVVPNAVLRQVGRGLGSLTTGVGVAYLFQWYRLTNQLDLSFTEFLGPAPWVALVAGVLMSTGR